MRKSSLSWLLVAAVSVGAATMAPAVPAQSAGGGATAKVVRNVYAAGAQVHPEAAVAGDFTAAGGKVIVDHPVGEDAALVGGAVDVRAPVGDDLRAAGGSVSIGSTVGGELFAAGGHITLTPTAAVAHGASLSAGDVAMQGRIDGALQARAGKITIDGEVRGDTRLVADEIELGPKARLGGALSYVASSFTRAEGATIAGPVTREPDAVDARAGMPMHGGAWSRSPGAPMGFVTPMSFVAFLACAVVFLLLLPRLGGNAPERIRSAPWRALAMGLATALAVPLLAMLLFVTVLGIPLAFVVLALYPALLLAGFVVGLLFLGRVLAIALRQPAPATFGAQLAYFALALLLALLAAGIPWLGGPLGVALSLLGLGACVLEIRDWRRGSPSPRVTETPGLGLPAQVG